MPVVIDEIVIQLDVQPSPAPGGGGAPAGGQAAAPADRQSLVAECVERVLEILRRREEP
jgi:hypothetical protein